MAKTQRQLLGAHAALFESQASLYAQFRPAYPAALYAAIDAFVGPAAPRQLALDVGCGSGQVGSLIAAAGGPPMHPDADPVPTSSPPTAAAARYRWRWSWPDALTR